MENKALIRRYKTIKLYGPSIETVKEVVSDLSSNEKVDFEFEEIDKKIHITLAASGETEDEAKSYIKPISKEIKERFGEKIYSTKNSEHLENVVVNLLEKNDLTISTAESCTGGLLAGKLINVPGVSEVFKEGFITYTNKSKRKTLGVYRDTLRKYGAVSEQTAKEMARGASLVSATDASLAVTGIAGPDGGTKTKPVGLVYIACCLLDEVTVEEFHFDGDRLRVREQSVFAALDLLRRCILDKFKQN